MSKNEALKKNRIKCALFASAASTCWTPAALADDPTDEIYVYGRAIDLLGNAQAASEGVVGYDDFKTRPISRIGELVEVIPGLVATQHSGSGKSNQYFLRGFNLDHGTDFAASIDGQPINFRTHGHGQGYLDLNFIIPEIVERVEFRKGPYSAETGDFGLAATAEFVTYDELEENFVQATIGENQFYRAVAAASLPGKNGNFLLAAETQFYDGPWVLDEDLSKINLFGKYTGALGGADIEISGSIYDADWTSTDQVPLRAIESGPIDRLGFIDPDLGGETTRISLNSAIGFDQFGGRTTARAYVINYDFNLFSNFTYFANDPINGDEFEQRDRRWVYGGSIGHANHIHLGERRINLNFGAELRYDDIIDIGLFQTVARERIATIRNDKIQEFSLSGYGSAEIFLAENLRFTAGLRGDYYSADVDALSLPANGGEANDTLISPSASLAWRAAEPLEFYLNYGEGFHSNDARGTTITIDPVTADVVDTVDLLVRGRSAEVGARWKRDGVTAAVSGYWIDLDSELVFVGDAGTTEPNDGTERFGIEGSVFWEAADWLVFDASGGYTDAAFKNAPAGEARIPGAVGVVFAAGAVARSENFTGSVRLRHFGRAPLIEDGSVFSEATTLVNVGAKYRLGRVELGLDVFNIFDSEDPDISYFFESQLAGEAAPVEDIHFHPVEPRQLRGSVRVVF